MPTRITETHKNFPCGAKGRVTVYGADGSVVAQILTPVQAARRYCEQNPDTPEGMSFRAAVDIAEGRTAVVAPVLPDPPVLSGKNSGNTAMQSAQRKLQRLSEAAAGPDPVAAVTAIHTARGNTYLNACDNYKTMLLQALSGNGVGEGSSNAV